VLGSSESNVAQDANQCVSTTVMSPVALPTTGQEPLCSALVSARLQDLLCVLQSAAVCTRACVRACIQLCASWLHHEVMF
jgi:hypothetical protein